MSEVYTYVCPSCGAAIPHEVTNTRCTPSGTVVDPTNFPPLPDGHAIDPLDEWVLWRGAANDAYWLIEGEID